MRINALRKEMAEIMASRLLKRTPAVRRSSMPEWIYATDILLLLNGDEQDSLLKELAGKGWEYREEHGWLQMRKSAPEPPEDWYEGSFGPEAACCASLLDRHPSKGSEAETAQRVLIKAGEEGDNAYEAACRQLHQEWAEQLRRGDPLPVLSRKYFSR